MIDTFRGPVAMALVAEDMKDLIKNVEKWHKMLLLNVNIV